MPCAALVMVEPDRECHMAGTEEAVAHSYSPFSCPIPALLRFPACHSQGNCLQARFQMSNKPKIILRPQNDTFSPVGKTENL